MDYPQLSMEIEENGNTLLIRTLRYHEDKIENLACIRHEMDEDLKEFFRILSLVPFEGIGAEAGEIPDIRFSLRESIPRGTRTTEKRNGYKTRMILDIDEKNVDKEENAINIVSKECALCGDKIGWVAEDSDFICQIHEQDEVKEYYED